MMRWLFLLLFLPTFAPQIVWANEPEMLGEYQKWSVYKYQEANGPVCYAMTRAAETKDAKGKILKIKGRGQVLFQVTRRPAENGNMVVSYVAGHNIKNKTPVELQSDKKKFKLRGDGDTAWAESAQIDADIVKAIRAGKYLTISHQDRKAATVVDIFSLKGAPAALTAIGKCD